MNYCFTTEECEEWQKSSWGLPSLLIMRVKTHEIVEVLSKELWSARLVGSQNPQIQLSHRVVEVAMTTNGGKQIDQRLYSMHEQSKFVYSLWAFTSPRCGTVRGDRTTHGLKMAEIKYLCSLLVHPTAQTHACIYSCMQFD